MTIKEFYNQAQLLGKEDYNMITIEMVKDREYRWFNIIPRYGIRDKVVIMEIGKEYKRDNG